MNKKIDNITVFIQLYLAGLTIVALIISFYTDILYYLLYILISSILFVQAYNNQKIYKRKNMTIIYILVAILFLGIGVVHAI